MIKNERQYKYAKSKLQEFEKELENIKKEYANDKNELNLFSQGYIEHISQLKKEIILYERMKRESLQNKFIVPNLSYINKYLLWLRVKRKITQTQLAKKVKCKQSDISRLEREGYCGYTLNQLYKINKALNVKIEIHLIPEERLIEKEELEVKEFPKELRDAINSIYQNTSSENLLKKPINISTAEEEHEIIPSII